MRRSLESAISWLGLARFEILTGPMSAEATVADTHAVNAEWVDAPNMEVERPQSSWAYRANLT